MVKMGSTYGLMANTFNCSTWVWLRDAYKKINFFVKSFASTHTLSGDDTENVSEYIVESVQESVEI